MHENGFLIMRNNERISTLIKNTLLVTIHKDDIIPTHKLTKAYFCFVLLLCAPYSSIASNRNVSHVDKALPALVSEGEAMQTSQSWYRAHTKKGSYTSAFTADGRLLALTSQNNPVELWDTIKRKPVSLFQGSGLSSSDAFVDLSADGKFIAINVGERIEVRSIENGLLEFSVPAISGGAATFSPNSKWFATAIDGKRIDLWDISTKKRDSSLIQHKKTISALGFSQDGNYLVSGDISGIFTVWDTNTKEMLYQYSQHTKPISTIQFSSVGNNFVTIDTSGAVKLWNTGTKILLHSFKSPKMLGNHQSSAIFSPDGSTLMVSFSQLDGKSHLVSFNTLLGGEPLFIDESNNLEISSIAYRPDGKSLVVALTSKAIKIFNIPSKQYVDTFGGQILKANKTRVSPDGKLFATGTADGYIQLWDADNKRLKFSLKGRNKSIENISFSPDGHYIIAGDSRGAITIWERDSNKRLLFINAHKQGATFGVMSPDNQFLATASSESSIIKLWDIKNNTSIFKFIGHHGDITGLAYSPDGKFIASSSMDGTIKLWNLSNKSLEQSFIGSGKTIGFLSLAFSPNGRFLAGGTHQGSADKHVIEIWDTQDLKHIRTLNKHDAAVTSVRFSANGQQLVSGSMDGTIKVWDVATGLSSHSFTNKETPTPIHSVDFTKDGKSILSVTQEGATDLWNLEKNTKSYTLLGGPRGTWVSEDHIKQRFVRGDDGSLNVKTSTNMPPAPLAPTGLATEDKLILTASRKSVKVSQKGGQFSITIKNIGNKPSFWLRAKQLNSNKSPITLLSNKLTRLDAGRRGVLNLQLIPHGLASSSKKKEVNLEMEVITKAGSHFPIVIPIDLQLPASNLKVGRNKDSN